MKQLTNTEKKVLDLMNKKDFRGISRNNVMELASILDKVDPEVAKALIVHIPEVVNGIVESKKAYTQIVSRGIDSCDASLLSCHEAEDEIIKILQNEMNREDLTFEQRRCIAKEMVEAVSRKEAKDTEHKQMILTIIKYSVELAVVSITAIAGVYIGKTYINKPTFHNSRMAG